jgi:SAM-dependent methyltransferase
MGGQIHWRLGRDVAECYERDLVPRVFLPWAVDLIALAQPRTGERVLDLACGTGVVARLATRYVGMAGGVVGLDVNRAMLSVAAEVSPHAQIRWSAASALALPFTNRAFDLILCQQGLPFFPDPMRALREMHRVLRPDGRTALIVWRGLRHSPGFAALVETVERYCGDAATVTLRASFGSGEADELSRLLRGAGFGRIDIRAAVKSLHFPSPAAFVQQYGAGSPLAMSIARLDETTRVALIRDVGTILRAYMHPDGLIFPIEAQMIRAAV